MLPRARKPNLILFYSMHSIGGIFPNPASTIRVSKQTIFVLSLEKCHQTRFLIFYNIALKNHVIRRLQLPTHLQCRAACSAQHGCLSFNFTPRQEGDGDCELNDSEDSQHPEDLEQRDGNKYYASQVRDKCSVKKTQSNRDSQPIRDRQRHIDRVRDSETKTEAYRQTHRDRKKKKERRHRDKILCVTGARYMFRQKESDRDTQ